MKLFIRYMVSNRCKMIVRTELEKPSLHYTTVEPGEVNVMEDITGGQRHLLNTALKKRGLELIDDKKAVLIEKIKNVIIEIVHYSEEPPGMKFSDFLSRKLDHDYTCLAHLFSEAEGTTIEHFIIFHKIERVKEWLVYNELTLTEIAYKMHYSSVAHLSAQFKKVTCLTPSYFKQMRNKRSNNLENI